MLPIVVLNLAWAEANGWSPSESAALLLDIDASRAIPADVGNVCPRCRRHPGESEGYLFDPESATATPEQVTGRKFVKCLCGTVYWYAAVHVVDVHQPIGEASVRAASEPVAPPPPMPALVTDGVFRRQTWYGREASMVFAAVRIAVLVLAVALVTSTNTRPIFPPAPPKMLRIEIGDRLSLSLKDRLIATASITNTNALSVATASTTNALPRPRAK